MTLFCSGLIFSRSDSRPYFNATRHVMTQRSSIDSRFASHCPIIISSGTGHIERQSFQPTHIKSFHSFLFHLFAFQLLKKQTTLFPLNNNARLLHAFARTCVASVEIRVRHDVSQTFSPAKHN
jgi:hypothetical protein